MDYIVNDTELTATADSIREKTGDTALIEWITGKGFADVIAGIESGGMTAQLPSGYAMEFGTVTLASDATSYITLTLENTYKWRTSDKSGNTFTALFAVDAYSGVSCVIASINFYNFAKNNGSRNFATNDTGSISTNATDFVGFGTASKDNILTLAGTQYYPLKAGITYFWVVVGEVA